MKNLIVAFTLFIFTACASHAQTKKYVSYTVKQGETLKSIAKDNGVSKRDLKRLNPDVGNKPRPNSVIIIPSKETATTVISSSETPTATTNMHTVQRKETLYSISKKYGVSVEALKKANNLSSNALSLGQKLVIPKEKKGFDSYVVKAKETKYGISKKYGISVAELEKINPAIKNGLKVGQTIFVPKTAVEEVVEVEVEETEATAEPANAEEGVEGTEAEISDALVDNLTATRPVNVAILLPFNLDKVGTNADFQKDRLLNITTDVYMGAKMAIDSLKSQGVAINYKAFDTKNDMKTINQMDLSDVDVVIGPLYFDKAVALSRKLKDAVVVSPVYSKKQSTTSASKLLKTAVEKKNYKTTLLNYIKANYNGEKLLLIGDDSKETAAQIANVKYSLVRHDSINTVETLVSKDGYIGMNRLTEKVGEEDTTWAIYLGEDKIIAMDAVTNLGALAQTRKVRLFAVENGKHFNDIDNNHLAKMNFTFAQGELADMTRAEVLTFFNKFKAKNHDIPSRFAIQGFDVTYDTLLRFVAFENLKDGLEAGVSTRVAQKFDYTKKAFGGFENNGIQIIRYNKDLYPVIAE